MERYLRQTGLLDMFVPGQRDGALLQKLRPADLAEIIWWFFAASVTFSMLPRFLGEPSGLMVYVTAFGGAAGCGWAWLLTRTLFRAEKPIVRWNLFALAGIVIVEGWFHLSGHGVHSDHGEVYRIAANAASLICIGTLMLVFVEALSGYSSSLPKSEQRFRLIFCLVFGSMIAIALVWASGATETSVGAGWVDGIVAASAFLCVVCARLAISFRKQHPLATAPVRKVPQAVSAAAADKALAARILQVLEQDQMFTTPDLKVADLATALREQEYKVTSCITGSLGYRNFNQLINARRIDHAKELLSDPQEQRPILSIALDCGFNSIGPFNRAFKEQAGTTPSAFRREKASLER